jgi:hypothetical protein
MFSKKSLLILIISIFIVTFLSNSVLGGCCRYTNDEYWEEIKKVSSKSECDNLVGGEYSFREWYISSFNNCDNEYLYKNGVCFYVESEKQVVKCTQLNRLECTPEMFSVPYDVKYNMKFMENENCFPFEVILTDVYNYEKGQYDKLDSAPKQWIGSGGEIQFKISTDKSGCNFYNGNYQIDILKTEKGGLFGTGIFGSSVAYHLRTYLPLNTIKVVCGKNERNYYYDYNFYKKDFKSLLANKFSFCGDGICQSEENYDSCSSDCKRNGCIGGKFFNNNIEITNCDTFISSNCNGVPDEYSFLCIDSYKNSCKTCYGIDESDWQCEDNGGELDDPNNDKSFCWCGTSELKDPKYCCPDKTIVDSSEDFEKCSSGGTEQGGSTIIPKDDVTNSPIGDCNSNQKIITATYHSETDTQTSYCEYNSCSCKVDDNSLFSYEWDNKKDVNSNCVEDNSLYCCNYESSCDLVDSSIDKYYFNSNNDDRLNYGNIDIADQKIIQNKAVGNSFCRVENDKISWNLCSPNVQSSSCPVITQVDEYDYHEPACNCITQNDKTYQDVGNKELSNCCGDDYYSDLGRGNSQFICVNQNYEYLFNCRAALAALDDATYNKLVNDNELVDFCKNKKINAQSVVGNPCERYNRVEEENNPEQLTEAVVINLKIACDEYNSNFNQNDIDETKSNFLKDVKWLDATNSKLKRFYVSNDPDITGVFSQEFNATEYISNGNNWIGCGGKDKPVAGYSGSFVSIGETTRIDDVDYICTNDQDSYSLNKYTALPDFPNSYDNYPRYRWMSCSEIGKSIVIDDELYYCVDGDNNYLSENDKSDDPNKYKNKWVKATILDNDEYRETACEQFFYVELTDFEITDEKYLQYKKTSTKCCGNNFSMKKNDGSIGVFEFYNDVVEESDDLILGLQNQLEQQVGGCWANHMVPHGTFVDTIIGKMDYHKMVLNDIFKRKSGVDEIIPKFWVGDELYLENVEGNDNYDSGDYSILNSGDSIEIKYPFMMFNDMDYELEIELYSKLEESSLMMELFSYDLENPIEQTQTFCSGSDKSVVMDKKTYVEPCNENGVWGCDYQFYEVSTPKYYCSDSNIKSCEYDEQNNCLYWDVKDYTDENINCEEGTKYILGDSYFKVNNLNDFISSLKYKISLEYSKPSIRNLTCYETESDGKYISFIMKPIKDGYYNYEILRNDVVIDSPNAVINYYLDDNYKNKDIFYSLYYNFNQGDKIKVCKKDSNSICSNELIISNINEGMN